MALLGMIVLAVFASISSGGWRSTKTDGNVTDSGEFWANGD